MNENEKQLIEDFIDFLSERDFNGIASLFESSKMREIAINEFFKDRESQD